MDLVEIENLKKSLTNDPQNNVVGKETYQKAKYLPVADQQNPTVSIFEHCLINNVNHEDRNIDIKNRQQKLASGCLWCIKQ